MRQLNFVEADADDLLAAVLSAPNRACSRIQVFGRGTLADGVVARTSSHGLVVERHDRPQSLIADEEKRIVVLTERGAPELAEQLMCFLDAREVTVIAPIGDWHSSRKPLFLISIPKAGTHLIYELANALGYGAGIEAPEFPRGGTWYCLEYSNSHTVARDFFVDTTRRKPFGNRHHVFATSPALFIYRHPLDVLVSEAHYYHRDGKTAFAGWFAGQDFEQRVERLYGENWLLGTLRERIGGFVPWLDFPNVLPISFEELIGAAGGGDDLRQHLLIWSLMLKLQVSGRPDEIAKTLFNRDSATFRSGRIGGYRDELPSPIVEDFCTKNADILGMFGYSGDSGSELPAPLFRDRAIRFSTSDTQAEAILLESGFMGCNLVRFGGKIYAIPMEVGRIDITAIGQAIRDMLPQADSVTDLKLRIILGDEEWTIRKTQMSRLSAKVREAVDRDI
jgi:hypothetical protein